jgi:hypothetical protein
MMALYKRHIRKESVGMESHGMLHVAWLVMVRRSGRGKWVF